MKRIHRIRENRKMKPREKLDAVFSLLMRINSFYENRLFTIDDDFTIAVNEDVSTAILLKSHSLIRVSNHTGVYEDRKVLSLQQRSEDLACVYAVIYPMNHYLDKEQRLLLIVQYFKEISKLSSSEAKAYLNISGTKTRLLRESAMENMIEILNFDTFDMHGEMRGATVVEMLRRERIRKNDKGYPARSSYQYRVDHPEWRWQRTHG